MKQYVIFGVGSFLSDIFDIIHANKGRVCAMYQNIPEVSRERTITLKERIALLGYDVKLCPTLDTFQPQDEYEYVIGCTVVQKYHLIHELKKRFKIRFSSLVHPEAYLGSNVHIGEGVIVSPRAVISPNAYLDDFCMINRAVSIGHEVHIGKFSRIGPSAVIAGSSRIGDTCSISMSASVLDHVYIGDWTVIGAGAVVTKDMPRGVIAYGIPAKVVRNNEQVDQENIRISYERCSNTETKNSR